MIGVKLYIIYFLGVLMVDFVERREMFGEDMEVEFFCDGCGLDKEECLCGKQKRMKEGRYEG